MVAGSGRNRAGPPVTGTYQNPRAWAAGADPVYEQLSRAGIATSPFSLSGRVVLDIGAGTGATSRAISRSHGWPIAVDLSLSMLAFRSDDRPPAMVADATRLPIPNDSVGGAVAAFCLSHVEAPDQLLRELARVVEPRGPVLALVFADQGPRHPASEAVTEAATQYGWSPPDWYRQLKDELEPAVADADRLQALAEQAGLIDVAVTDAEVDTGISDPDQLVGWRLAGPAFATFFDSLSSPQQKRLTAEAARALGDEPSSLLLRIRTMSGSSS